MLFQMSWVFPFKFILLLFKIRNLIIRNGFLLFPVSKCYNVTIRSAEQSTHHSIDRIESNIGNSDSKSFRSRSL